MNNAEIFRILIIAHAALGGISLVSGFIAAITKKGSRTHIISGRIFYYSLGGSILLSLIAANMPDHYNPFLFSVGIFSGYFILIGKRAIQYKSPTHSFTVDKIIHFIMLLTCFLMVVVPLIVSKSFHIVAGVFGLLGFIFAIRNLLDLRHLDQVRKNWLKMHIGNISGGYIASVTAFVVVNDFFPGVYSWFVPGVIGGLFIYYSIRKIDNKLKSDILANKMFLLIVLVLSLTSVVDINGQISTGGSIDSIKIKILTKKQMLEDHEILFSSIKNYHPTPFMYTSEQEYTAFYNKQRFEFPDSLIEMDFNIIAKKLIAQLKCGHTYSNLSDDWYASVKGKNLLLPFDIKRIGNKVYFNNTIDTTFEFNINDEILSINNMPINDILQQMAAIQERDGLTLSFANEMSVRKFRNYYLFLYGFQNNFSIEFKTKSEVEKTTVVKPTNLKLKESIKVQIPSNFKRILDNQWSSFSFDSINQIAYLDINSFGDTKEYKKYYKQVFQYLAQFPDPQLIIDLRDNGGGDFRNGNHFLTYLTPKTFRFNFQKPKSIKDKNEHVKLGKWSKLTEFAFSIKPKKYKIEGQKTRTFTYKPNKLLFSGKVHVINNDITFSQASLISAQLYENGAKMYGAETGGTENSTNAMIIYNLVLPNSKIKANIAHYQIVSNSTKGVFGYGVKPDYPLLQSLNRENDDILLNTIDIILNKKRN
jgi:hypothetical protein